MLEESLILCNNGNILLSLTLKGKHNFNHFYYKHIVEVPTQKGEHSRKCKELSFKQKEGIMTCCL